MPFPDTRPIRAGAFLSALVLGMALLAGGSSIDGVRAASEWATGEKAQKVCPFRARTGLPCMGCGGTRAFHAASRGHFLAASQKNILGAFAGLSTWLLSLASALTALTGRPRALLVVFVLVLAFAPIALVWNGVSWWWSLPAGAFLPR